MHFSNVNLLSVLAAGVATMILGFVWYSPALFAKPWMREMGYDLNDKAKLKEMQKSAGPTYGIAFLACLVSAFMLGKILSITPIDTALYGMKLGLGVWLGYIRSATPCAQLEERSYSRRWFSDSGFHSACRGKMNSSRLILAALLLALSLGPCRAASAASPAASAFMQQTPPAASPAASPQAPPQRIT